MEYRKVTYKLYPNVAEAARLQAWLGLHCEPRNAALQERIDAYRKAGHTCTRCASRLGTIAQYLAQRCGGLSWRVFARCNLVPVSATL